MKIKAEVELYRDQRDWITMSIRATDGVSADITMESFDDANVGAAFVHWAAEKLNKASEPISGKAGK